MEDFMSNQDSPIKGFHPLDNVASSRTDAKDQPVPVMLNDPQASQNKNGFYPSSQATDPNPQSQGSRICPNCFTPNSTNASFCYRCGRPLSKVTPSQTPTMKWTQDKKVTAGIEKGKSYLATNHIDMQMIWALIAGLAAILALIYFNKPWVEIKFNIPSIFSYSDQKLKIPISGYNLITLKMPSVEGMEEFGEYSESLFNELFSTLALDRSVNLKVNLVRGSVILFLLLLLANIFLVYQIFKTGKPSLNKWIIALSAVSIIFLLVAMRIAKNSINSINYSTDYQSLNLLVDAAIKNSTGSGYRGMLISLFIFGFAGFMRNRQPS